MPTVPAPNPDLADVPGLHTLWAQFVMPAQTAGVPPPPLRTLLDCLGLGLAQTLEHLGRARPDWTAFLAWIEATAGPPDPALLARYAAWHAGAPPPAAERARQADRKSVV